MAVSRARCRTPRVDPDCWCLEEAVTALRESTTLHLARMIEQPEISRLRVGALQSLLLKRAVKFPGNLKRGGLAGVAIVESVFAPTPFGRSRKVSRLTPGIVADVRMRSARLDLIGERGSEKRSNDVARVLSVCILSHMRVLGADCTTQSDINHTDSG
jgi:hypothetical protein